MGLRADWSIEVDGRDITDGLRPRLVSLSVTDGKARRADKCTIVLQDNPPVDWPAGGREVRIRMGWDGQLISMGTYRFGAPRSSGPTPPQISVEGQSVPAGGRGVRDLMRARASASHEDTTLGELASVTADALGLSAQVAPDCEDRPIPYVEQDDETHLGMLSRVAEELGAEVKVRDAMLIVTDQHTLGSASGHRLGALRIDPEHVESWDGEVSERSRYASAVARWIDVATGESGEAWEGEQGAEPVKVLEVPFPSESAARSAATASLFRARGRKATLNLTIYPGRPELSAGQWIDLSDALRPGLAGAWSIDSVTHTLAGKNISTRLSCKTPAPPRRITGGDRDREGNIIDLASALTDAAAVALGVREEFGAAMERFRSARIGSETGAEFISRVSEGVAESRRVRAQQAEARRRAEAAAESESS